MDLWNKLTPRYAWQSDDDYAAHVQRFKDGEQRRIGELVKVVGLVASLDLPAPSIYSHWEYDWQVRWLVGDIGDVREVRRAIGSPGGGVWSKVTEAGAVGVELTWGSVRLVVQAAGETCEQVVVGTETVETIVDVCPDCESDLAGQSCSAGCGFEVRLPGTARRTVERNLVEWRCPDLNGQVTT